MKLKTAHTISVNSAYMFFFNHQLRTSRQTLCNCLLVTTAMVTQSHHIEDVTYSRKPAKVPTKMGNVHNSQKYIHTYMPVI